MLFRLDFYQQSRTDLVGGRTKFLFGEIGQVSGIYTTDQSLDSQFNDPGYWIHSDRGRNNFCAISDRLDLKRNLFAKLSGFLLLLFALAMTFSSGIKGALDFSVFSASAAAFALSLMKEKALELDGLISKSSSFHLINKFYLLLS